MKKSLLLFLLTLTVSCKDTIKPNSKHHREVKHQKTNSTGSINDFVSSLDLGEVYNNELSTDFVILGVFGNELYEHYKMCKTKDLNLYSYDTLWNIEHSNEDTADQDKPRLAFLTKENFHLMETEQWDTETNDYIIDSYKPSKLSYKYHLGNGFAFNKTNEISDFNSDGFIDVKIEYTKLDYEGSDGWPRSIRNEMESEYIEKVKKSELSKTVKFEDYEKEQWELHDNFGMYGDGYITRQSDNGLIYFFTLD